MHFFAFSAYFERVLHLNAAVWSCAVTEKPGLTFSEAVEHEAQSLVRTINSVMLLIFPFFI